MQYVKMFMFQIKKISQYTGFVLSSFTISILLNACASTKEGTSKGVLVVQEQGSFAVGGTVITNSGTFDPIAKQFRDVINRHGGDVTLAHLPEIGIKGNTHFPMSDLNNVEVANHLSNFLKSKRLD